jgi:hypothetical protein
MSKQKSKGRPSKYMKTLGDEICTRIAGGESLRAICRESDKPVLSTVLLWVVDEKHKHFSEQYARSRIAAGYSHADEMLELRHRVVDGELEPQAAKVVMDALKWGAERMAPKKHGAHQTIEHSVDNDLAERLIASRKRAFGDE